MFSRIILILLPLTVSKENEATDNTAATCVKLQRELVRQERETGQMPNPRHIEEAHANVTHEMGMYCCSSPCVIFSETHPARLRAFGQPRLNNHMKLKGDYRSFYTILNHCSSRRDPVYIAGRKHWDVTWKMLRGSCSGGHTSLCCGRCLETVAKS